MRELGVLIIDDDALFRRTLTWLLNANGFTVELAASGMQAYSIISTKRFDLIIIDIILPDVDGLELIRWIRERADLADVPIMVVSAYDRNYLVAAISAGADEALHKPDDLDRIVEAARKLLERAAHTGQHPDAYQRAS
jgi:DNA-binding response OmpR family regulator